MTAAIGLASLAACADIPRPGETPASVRHVGGTRYYQGDQLHLFLYDPAVPRPLGERVRLAQRALRGSGCDWVGAPDDVLQAETARQGARYAETMLVAPLRCG